MNEGGSLALHSLVLASIATGVAKEEQLIGRQFSAVVGCYSWKFQSPRQLCKGAVLCY